jgi:hypothetical protein
MLIASSPRFPLLQLLRELLPVSTTRNPGFNANIPSSRLVPIHSAHDHADSSGRKTVAYQDVFQALSMIQYGGSEEGVALMEEVLTDEINGQSIPVTRRLGSLLERVVGC